MRQLLYFFSLGLMIFVVYCNKNNSNEQRNVSSKEGKALQESVSDSVRFLLSGLKNGSEISDLFVENLLRKFKENENIAKGAFPSREGDVQLFYGAMELLTKRAENDDQALKLLIKLSCVMKRSAEFADKLIKLTPRLATQNISGFVAMYKQLDSAEKTIAIQNLEYLEGPSEYKLFQAKLDGITDDSLKQTASEIKKRLEEYLMK